MNPQSYTINIRPGWGIPPTVKVSQYDVGRPLAFVLMDGQEALSVASGTTVTLEGTKPSGLGFTQACTLDGNTATISTVATMTQEAGCIPCELVVAVGNTTIGTANFKLVVELSAHPEGTTDGDRETAKDLMTRAVEAVEQAEAAAESISQAGIDTTGSTAGQVPTAKGDGTWTWEDQQGGGSSTVDAELSTTSENPVQNKAIAQAVGALSDEIVSVEGGAPTQAQTVAQMVDTSKVYLYTGSEEGYIFGAWYHYNGTDWVYGGMYGEAASMSAGVKAALLACFQKVAWIDENGQTYYDNLYNELYPHANLVSITAVYTQSGTVYDTASLDDLKPDLVVTANYSDGTSETVTTYTLSGTLSEGTSTITVSYGGKTTAFSVTVEDQTAYVTDGLFAYWDAIDNQATGQHDTTATTWIDLVNGYTWTAMKTDGSQTWEWSSNALNFNTPGGSSGTNGKNTFQCARPGTGLRTLEVVFIPADVIGCVGEFTSDLTGITDNTTQILGVLPSDDTVTSTGVQNGYEVTDITSIKSITATYNASSAAVKLYKNSEEITSRGSSHSFRYHHYSDMILGAQNSSGGNLTYGFKGIIHAIRMYDRELTAAEIAHNYALDVQRFGLS